eukprot:Opistho-2@89852
MFTSSSEETEFSQNANVSVPKPKTSAESMSLLAALSRSSSSRMSLTSWRLKVCNKVPHRRSSSRCRARAVAHCSSSDTLQDAAATNAGADAEVVSDTAGFEGGTTPSEDAQMPAVSSGVSMSLKLPESVTLGTSWWESAGDAVTAQSSSRGTLSEATATPSSSTLAVAVPVAATVSLTPTTLPRNVARAAALAGGCALQATPNAIPFSCSSAWGSPSLSPWRRSTHSSCAGMPAVAPAAQRHARYPHSQRTERAHFVQQSSREWVCASWVHKDGNSGLSTRESTNHFVTTIRNGHYHSIDKIIVPCTLR